MKNKLIKKGYSYSLSLFTSVSQSALRAERAGRREGVRRREDMASRVNWDRTCNTSRGWLAHETCKTNPGWLLGSMKKNPFKRNSSKPQNYAQKLLADDSILLFTKFKRSISPFGFDFLGCNLPTCSEY